MTRWVGEAWRVADADSLLWTESVAFDLDAAGLGVGPMPDKVWVVTRHADSWAT